QLRGGNELAEELLRLKGRRGQGGGVQTAEQVEHGGVSCEHQGGDAAGLPARLAAQGPEHIRDGLPHAGGQTGADPVHGPADPADHIGAEGALGVGGGGGGQQAGAVVELGGQGGGADVHGGPQDREQGVQ